MRYTWMFIITVLAVGVIGFLAWYRYRINKLKRGKKHDSIIAHTATIKQLPAYRKAVKYYFILLGTAAACLALALFSFTAIAARPTEVRADRNINKTRDVVLCMDMSGSMVNYQRQILTHFIEIAEGLDGERIGVTVFDSVPINIVPLSDDYVAAKETIEDLRDNYTLYHSTSRNGGGNSNIGEGVMGCINSFDTLGDERTQSVIIATDNIRGANSKITIAQAIAYGRKYGVSFYGLSIDGTAENSFESYVNQYWNIEDLRDNQEEISTILDRIFEQEAVKIETARELVAVDAPETFIIIGIVSFTLLMIILWRLHL
ncbi:VWA domain-containing protein [Candidatus Saccharibacteria bacterium]|nr:VWA domain-containing protein [Candidatus Saccharibacteria bacterium]